MSQNNFDVIVLGVGGMGSAACYHLAHRGAKVLGLEKFSVAHDRGSSHGETRIIRKAYYEHPNYVPLLHRAYELWEELESLSKKKLYHQTGLLYQAPEGSPLLRGIRKSALDYKIQVDEVSDADLEKYREQFQVFEDHRCLWEPEAGFLEVENCVATYVDEARKLGLELRCEEEVLGWTSNGNSITVTTRQGEYRAKKLVVCAGAWSANILRELHLPLKILQKKLFWFEAPVSFSETQGMPCFLFERPQGVFYGFPSLAGANSLKVAEHSGGKPLESASQLSKGDDPTAFLKVKNFVEESLPGLGSKLLKQTSCMYTMTPDEHFVIDRHPHFENVSLACGFSGHGFKFASVVGEVLSELTLEGTTGQSIDFIKIDRLRR